MFIWQTIDLKSLQITKFCYGHIKPETQMQNLGDGHYNSKIMILR